MVFFLLSTSFWCWQVDLFGNSKNCNLLQLVEKYRVCPSDSYPHAHMRRRVIYGIILSSYVGSFAEICGDEKSKAKRIFYAMCIFFFVFGSFSHFGPNCKIPLGNGFSTKSTPLFLFLIPIFCLFSLSPHHQQLVHSLLLKKNPTKSPRFFWVMFSSWVPSFFLCECPCSPSTTKSTIDTQHGP